MKDYDIDVIRLIGPIALDAHKLGTGDSIISLPNTVDYSIFKSEAADFKVEEATFSFCSTTARKRMVAAYIYLDNKECSNDSDFNWFSVAYELWHHEIGESESAAGMLLAKVHQESDIFLIGKTLIENKLLRVFDVLHLIESAMPYLVDLPIYSVLELIRVQHEGTKNDLAGGMFFNKLEGRLITLPDTCLALRLCLLSVATESTINIYPLLLIALAKSSAKTSLELALIDSSSPNKIIQNAAIWTLGRFITLRLYEEDAANNICKEIEIHTSSANEDIRRTALRTAASTTHMTDTFDVCLTTMAEANDQYVLGLIVDALYMNTIEISLKPCFSDWLTLLSNISSENIGILNQLDFALSQLIRDESHQQSVISCWTIWCSINAEDIPRDKSVADIFDNTLNELARNSQLLSSVITDWFLDENRKLASAAAGLLSKLWVNGFRNVEFYTLRLDELTHDDLMFLARRMLGFVFAEEHLLSLSLSLLKTNNAKNRTYGIIRSLLAEEVGQDYPYSTIEALEKMKASTVEAELINFLSSIVHTINNRMEALDALPRLNELIPSIHLKREFEKARDKQMQASMEDAQKGSIMRQICTEIPIKAGVGFFSFRDGAYDEPTKMQSISHSVSVPLRHVRDAVGQDIAQLLFRIAKREG